MEGDSDGARKIHLPVVREDHPAASAVLAYRLRPRRPQPVGDVLLFTQLFKALLLQQWYQLSDPGLEEALTDRISFDAAHPPWARRFCGFSLDEITPDETTFVRFRAALAEAGLAEMLFAEVARQLESQGLILKTGTLIDATLLEAAVRRPPMDEGEVSEQDPEAGFTRCGQKSFFGYKAHLAVDQGSDLVRRAILTGVDLGDSLVAKALIQGDKKAVFGDKAYD